MISNQLLNSGKKYFPNLQFKYKDQNNLMRVLGVLLFFNPSFTKSFITTIGNTIYWPTEKFLEDNPEDAIEIFIHECTHMHDEKRVGSFLFKIGYLFPQILFLPMLLLFFLVNWKIALPVVLLCLLPLPAPFRAYFERRAYFISLYVGYKLFWIDPTLTAVKSASYFANQSYYWMMPFGEADRFAQEAKNIVAGNPACASEPALKTMVDDLMNTANQGEL